MARNTLNTEFVSEDDSPGLALWRVTNAWQAAQRAALRPFGLTHVQFVLLASLEWLHHDGPVSQRQLADHSHSDVMMTSQVVRALEHKELVIREAHPTDGRAFSIRATPAGSRLVNRAIAEVERVDRAFFDNLPDRGKRLARDLNALL